jgi:hypothetical protein
MYLNSSMYFCSVVKGGVAEWSNAPVLKTDVPQGTGGSNPSTSAKKKNKITHRENAGFFCAYIFAY